MRLERIIFETGDEFRWSSWRLLLAILIGFVAGIMSALLRHPMEAEAILEFRVTPVIVAPILKKNKSYLEVFSQASSEPLLRKCNIDRSLLTTEHYLQEIFEINLVDNAIIRVVSRHKDYGSAKSCLEEFYKRFVNEVQTPGSLLTIRIIDLFPDGLGWYWGSKSDISVEDFMAEPVPVKFSVVGFFKKKDLPFGVAFRKPIFIALVTALFAALLLHVVVPRGGRSKTGG